jgi:hypothetical protein
LPAAARRRTARSTESFEVGDGVLLWKADGMTFLLQGTGSKADATRLAAKSPRNR